MADSVKPRTAADGRVLARYRLVQAANTADQQLRDAPVRTFVVLVLLAIIWTALYFLLRTIFYPGTPLHDLAVVIRGERIVAAGCLLPLTERRDVRGLLGTRHRAALGLSETTDAAVIVVSEETGAISLAVEGKLYSNLTPDILRQRLLSILAPAPRAPRLRLGRRERAA